jgi:hypothetical protein
VRSGAWNWRAWIGEVTLGVLENAECGKGLKVVKVVKRREKQEDGRKPEFLAMTRAEVHIVRMRKKPRRGRRQFFVNDTSAQQNAAFAAGP